MKYKIKRVNLGSFDVFKTTEHLNKCKCGHRAKITVVKNSVTISCTHCNNSNTYHQVSKEHAVLLWNISPKSETIPYYELPVFPTLQRCINTRCALDYLNKVRKYIEFGINNLINEKSGKKFKQRLHLYKLWCNYAYKNVLYWHRLRRSLH